MRGDLGLWGPYTSLRPLATQPESVVPETIAFCCPVVATWRRTRALAYGDRTRYLTNIRVSVSHTVYYHMNRGEVIQQG